MELTELCKELNNWFCKEQYFGDFTISNNMISSLTLKDDSLQVGQYFRIAGSVFNDGVYTYPASGLIDEVFHGAVWAMAVPPTVIALLDDINTWLSDPGIQKALNSPYQSESFGGYSYNKGGGGSASGSSLSGLSWKTQFASRLNQWRKIRP